MRPATCADAKNRVEVLTSQGTGQLLHYPGDGLRRGRREKKAIVRIAGRHVRVDPDEVIVP